MKEHQKEIIKFIFQPITKPATFIAKEIWEMITLLCKTLLGDDGSDAWAIFVVSMIVMFFVFALITYFLQVILWKTFVAMFITSYCTLYYVRDYRERKKNES